MSRIKSIEYFACGSCENRLSHLFRDTTQKQVTFPAGVFLIHHETQGYWLYDTGYDAAVTSPHWKYWIYRLPNPIQMTPDLAIDAQLLAKGISPQEIRGVFVSHLHPDHIGRLRAFSQAQFFLTAACYNTYQQPALKDLVFKEYFPEDFSQRCQVLQMRTPLPLLGELMAVDVFGDGSLWAFSLDGHAKGQLCLWSKEKNLILAADALWQLDFIDKTAEMKPLPRLIQNDFKAYQSSVTVLQRFLEQGVNVLVSHDPEERVKEVLDA